MILGASAVLSNGTVIGSAGAAAVATAAQARGRPVIIACEAYKFHERVQLDSITSNELGNPQDLVHVPSRPDIDALLGWESVPCLGACLVPNEAQGQLLRVGGWPWS